MGSQKIEHYTHPAHFEPLLPGQHKMGPLLERASDLTRAASRLTLPAGQLPMRQLGELLRRMNSYYTNRLEGEHTRPSEIERALHDDYSRSADLARRQRLAVAHIRTELSCEAELDGWLAIEARLPRDSAFSSIAMDSVLAALYGPEALQWLHRELFSELEAGDLRLTDGSSMVPGEFRERQVSVGRHEAPLHTAVPGFLGRWNDVYARARRGEQSIVALAAAHHRLTWIHPFPDGNGRVARLHSHLMLRSMGLTHGLWSPLRGFARTEERYKATLAAADEHRRGDLDGRGNLTEAGLIDWIDYCLDTFIDQANFMGEQLNVATMRERIAAALAFESSIRRSGVRSEALIPLHYLFATAGSIPRAAFKTMTGLGDRTATSLVSALVERGFLESDTAYGDVRFGIPDHALRFYFPALWPEAEQEQASRGDA
ncbi:MAG TPA: Fic family protein [Burkholderiaceae bacterium]